MSDFKEMLQAHTNDLHHHLKPSSSSLAADSLFSTGPTQGSNNANGNGHGNGMNFASNFFSTSSFPDGGGGGDFRSFSHLLASGGGGLSLLAEERDNGGSGGSGFKQNRPGNLVLPVTVSPTFAVSPGFSPSAFFNSPTFFSSSLSPFGMSCQQTMAQAAASQQAPLSQPYLGIQAEFHPSSTTTTTHPLSSSLTFQSTTFSMPSSRQLEPSNAPKRPQTSFPNAVDKPADDGYNWRKYGQKQVKGSEYPRSYYKCTNPNCPVKKKVERSFEGHITEIIYKGQHNHERPQTGRRGGRDTNSNSLQVDQGRVGNFQWSGGIGRDHDSAQATSMQLHGPSDSEESGENYQLEDDENDCDDDDEPRAKIRNTGAGLSDVPYTHKTMTEPKIVVQTRSEVDLLDDGYRWRKYGQKVVKGNPNPRSYYKCTTVGCKVRKHVERASTDRRAVITTYEGKHNHDVPAARGSSNLNATSNVEAQQTTRLQSSAAGHMIFGSKEQRSIALTLKEEQVAL